MHTNQSAIRNSSDITHGLSPFRQGRLGGAAGSAAAQSNYTGQIRTLCADLWTLRDLPVMVWVIPSAPISCLNPEVLVGKPETAGYSCVGGQEKCLEMGKGAHLRKQTVEE